MCLRKVSGREGRSRMNAGSQPYPAGWPSGAGTIHDAAAAEHVSLLAKRLVREITEATVTGAE